MNLLGFPYRYSSLVASNIWNTLYPTCLNIQPLQLQKFRLFSLYHTLMFLSFLTISHLFIYSRNHKSIPAKKLLFLSLLLLLSVQTIYCRPCFYLFFLLYLRSYFTLTALGIPFFFALSLSVLWFINPILRQIDFYSTNNIFDFYSFPPNMPPLCLFECPSISVPYTEFHIFAKVYQYGFIPTLFIFLTLCFFLLFPFKRLSCFSFKSDSFIFVFTFILIGDLLHYVKFLYSPSIFAIFLVLFTLKASYSPKYLSDSSFYE